MSMSSQTNEAPKRIPIYKRRKFVIFLIPALIAIGGVCIEMMGMTDQNFANMQFGLLLFVVGVMLDIALYLEDRLSFIQSYQIYERTQRSTLFHKYNENLTSLNLRMESLEQFNRGCRCVSSLIDMLANRSNIGSSLEELLTNLESAVKRRGRLDGVIDIMTAEVIDSMADEIRREIFVTELRYYTEWVEKAMKYFISKDERDGRPKAFCTSILLPSEWKKGIDGGVYKAEFKAYKELFETYRNKLDTTRVLLMTEEQMKRENPRITAEFIRDHETHDIALLFFDTTEAKKEPSLERFVTDFVMLYDKKEIIVIHIATRKIMRYVPLEVLDKSSLLFKTYESAKKYFAMKGVCQPASKIFELCFGKDYQSVLRSKKQKREKR